MALLALVGKELRTFLRDAALVFVVVFAFVGHPYQSGSQVTSGVNNYPVAIYDLDRSRASTAFVDKLRAPYFAVRRYVEREAEITALLDRGEVSTIVIIPDGFGRRLHRGQPASIQVLSDGTYSLLSQRAGAYVAALAREFAEEQQHTPGHHGSLPVVDARVRTRYNPDLQPQWPQAMSMLLEAVTLVSILLPAAFMVREKEQGTIEQLLVSPLRPWQITASKIVPMMLVTVVTTLASLGVMVQAFDLPIRGSLALFLLATALVVFSTGGISLVIATITRTLPSALILAFMLIIPFQFLSGSFTPVEAMPRWQAWLTLLAPQRYYLNIAYGVLLKGASLRALWTDFAGLATVGSVLFVIGTRRFARQFE